MLDTIRWHGASSFALLNGVHIYINPRRIVRPDRPADLILIGSRDFDHFSPADIDKLRDSHTRIIASESAARVIDADVVLRPWQSTAIVEKACVKGVPIYDASGRVDPSGDLGFVVSTSRNDIFYTGGTQALPDTAALHPDIVILPIGGDRLMSPSAAAAALREMRPRYVVPYGWDANGASRTRIAAAQAFVGSIDPEQVIILDPTP